MFIMPKLTHDGVKGNTHEALDNSEVKLFLNSLDSFTYRELPSWLDDCLSGAAGQITGSRVRPSRIFGLLSCLDSISPSSVAQVMNRKRLAMGDEPYSDRYCRMIAAACRCGSRAITHHKGYNPPVIQEPKLPPVTALPYSEDEMRELKRLSINAPFSDLQAYEAELKAKYNPQ